MSHYIDIQIRPDPEVPTHQLMAALYYKLHRELTTMASNAIGVSFPNLCDMPHAIGDRMRLIGTAADLATLVATDWLRGVRDHVLVSAVAIIPSSATHRTLRRVQAKSNPDRIRRRQMKRHGLTEAEAREKIPDNVARTLDLPFIQLKSGSTGHSFLLFLQLGQKQPGPLPGVFNSYGLSATATIPCF